MTGRVWLVLIFSLFILFGLGYSLLMPVWEGPDEYAHYHLAWSLARRGEYPPPHMNYEVNQPPLYYWLASKVLVQLDKIDSTMVDLLLPKERYYRYIGQPVRIFNWTPENYRFLWGVQVLRWLNLCLGGVALLLIYHGARRMAPGSPLIGLTSLALAGLMPQYLHIVSTVSNDALAILAGAFLFWLLSRICTGQLTLGPTALAVASALILPVVTKLTVLPVGITVLAAVAWRWREVLRSHWKWSLVILGVLLAGLALGFDRLSPGRFAILVSEFNWRGLSLHPEAFSPGYFLPVLRQTVWSYWGKVGWLAVGLPVEIVILFTGLALLGSAASLLYSLPEPVLDSWRRIFRALRRSSTSSEQVENPQKPTQIHVPPIKEVIIEQSVVGFLWLAAGLALLMLAKNGLTTPRNQGRFLFPSLGVISLIVVNGWYLLSPARVHRWILPLVVISLSAANIFLWVSGIIPVYFQPFFD